MHYGILCCAATCAMMLSSCATNLASLPDRSAGQIDASYTMHKDVAYGADPEQVMDIYLSKTAASFGKRNYTIVFLHGGAYYLSDKTEEEKYIEPYLRKGLNVVNLNYRLKRGITAATSDLPLALNFLQDHNEAYPLKLDNIIVTGFSAGAQIATNVGLAQNNPSFPDRLDPGIRIVGIINFSGPVDQLDVIEQIFVDHEYELFSAAGKALFPEEGYAAPETVAVYEPVNYFDRNDPPVFLWHGGQDDQIPPDTFRAFTGKFRAEKDVLQYVPEGKHSPTSEELAAAYAGIFAFLDALDR
ncbi:acetyl esterase/lipase [Lewinella aquimaris]|uniref:Acetyl esterase/lipase n=1 Tax=Neolewinella aquimaris TaxID=1835722 RepID=A0A840DXU7_9BACT|nr:alpha/beta hydrolase [Neolewinella aquimaris]MBB4078034.1 acetyl esterase/lipase [Neolewinella aquimaris]